MYGTKLSSNVENKQQSNVQSALHGFLNESFVDDLIFI